MKSILVSVLIALGMISLASAESIPQNTSTIVHDTISKKDVKLPLIVYLQDHPAPTIIYAHGCNGIIKGAQNAKDTARYLMEWGYNVVIFDSYSPRKATNTCASYVVPMIERRLDIAAAADWITQQSWWQNKKIGVIGFSDGGGAEMYYANDPPNQLISAIVAFYPECLDTPYAAKIPTQIHMGELDDWVGTHCMKVKDAEKFVYKGAYHSFDRGKPGDKGVNEGHHLEHNEDATQLSHERARKFFHDHLDD